MPSPPPKARFHVDFGPSSLFERIAFKFNEPRSLKTHSKHFDMRALERNANVAAFSTFDPLTWRIVMAEVRTDTGKFVTTTWQVEADQRLWWIVIGYHDTIMTVISIHQGRNGRWSESINKSGELYEFVKEVNAALMENERNESNAAG